MLDKNQIPRHMNCVQMTIGLLKVFCLLCIALSVELASLGYGGGAKITLTDFPNHFYKSLTLMYTLLYVAIHLHMHY